MFIILFIFSRFINWFYKKNFILHFIYKRISGRYCQFFKFFIIDKLNIFIIQHLQEIVLIRVHSVIKLILFSETVLMSSKPSIFYLLFMDSSFNTHCTLTLHVNTLSSWPWIQSARLNLESRPKRIIIVNFIYID